MKLEKEEEEKKEVVELAENAEGAKEVEDSKMEERIEVEEVGEVEEAEEEEEEKVELPVESKAPVIRVRLDAHHADVNIDDLVSSLPIPNELLLKPTHLCVFCCCE